MKRNICLILAAALIASVTFGCSPQAPADGAASASGSSQAAGTEITLFSIQTTDPDFSKWKSKLEAATGLKINVIAAPTDSDTRQAKITTILSSGDSSVDIIEVNDEMVTSFKNTGWLEPLNDTVMTDDIIGKLAAKGYIKDMLTDKNGKIIGVPSYQGYLAWWVNQEFLDKAGMTEIKTRDDFVEFLKRTSGNGKYGYGGSWEKTYSFNEIATFVNLFGGDYLDWTNPNNKKALEFMKSMVDNGWTPIDQIADKYEQMNQKFIDGKYGIEFMWGSGGDFDEAGVRGSDKIHMMMVPKFATQSIFTDNWSYVLNTASTKKDAAYKFLQYTAGPDGEKSGWDNFDRYPARTDIAESYVPNDNFVKAMYTQYATQCTVRGRPMLPQTMEFITEMGTLFQDYVQGKITVDQFCDSAQKSVKANA